MSPLRRLSCAECQRRLAAGNWSGWASAETLGGIQAERGDGHLGINIFGAVTVTSSVRASTLTRQLAPPAMPVYRPPTMGILISVLLILPAFLAWIVVHMINPIGGVLFALGILLFMALIIGFDIVRAPGLREEHARQVWYWEQAMERWNHMFYCARCDHVYNPQIGQAAPIGYLCEMLRG